MAHELLRNERRDEMSPPSIITPIESVDCEVYHVDDNKYEVHYADGKVEIMSVEDFNTLFEPERTSQRHPFGLRLEL